MHVEGMLAPETPAAARERHAELAPAAQAVVREVARAAGFDRAEYRERVTEDVVASAHEALFASLLSVHVGTREAFADWRADHPGCEVVETGSPDVDGVVWHPAPFADTVVAATFEDRERAAVGALRRQAFGRIYREHL